VLVIVLEEGGEGEFDQNAEDDGASGDCVAMLMELMGTAAASRRSLRVERKAVVASAPAAALAPATATRVLIGMLLVCWKGWLRK